jgi:hypothetical protein
MHINIKNIKIFCLTCESEEGRRRSHIKDILNPEFVEPMIGIPKNKSGASGFMRMVERGLKLQNCNEPFQPFLMLEDDISIHRDIDSIDIPDDADILYVGLSKCSMNDHRYHYENYYESVPDYSEIIRIKHMLATHGIMICSPLGAAVFQRAMLEVYQSDQAWDIPLAFLQPYYNVYALRNPYVYQDETYGGDENCTKITLYGPDRILPNEWITKDSVSLRML